MQFWTEDNIKLLNSDQKNKLCEIQEKIKKGTALDESDKKALFELEMQCLNVNLAIKNMKNLKN